MQVWAPVEAPTLTPTKQTLLEVQKNLTEEKPVFDSKGLCLITDKFASYREYCNILYPLLMHELWADVYKNYIQEKKTIFCVPNRTLSFAKKRLYQCNCGRLVKRPLLQ